MIDPQPVTDEGAALLALNLPELETLNLEGQATVTDIGVGAIVAHMNNLSELNLKRPAQLLREEGAPQFAITDVGILRLARLQQLCVLRLSECWVGDKGCAALAKLPGLQVLELSACQQLTNIGGQPDAYMLLAGVSAAAIEPCGHLALMLDCKVVPLCCTPCLV